MASAPRPASSGAACPLLGEEVGGSTCPCPVPFQALKLLNPWFLASLSPGRSCGSAVESHMLSSVAIFPPYTKERTYTHKHTHAVPSKQRPSADPQGLPQTCLEPSHPWCCGEGWWLAGHPTVTCHGLCRLAILQSAGGGRWQASPHLGQLYPGFGGPESTLFAFPGSLARAPSCVRGAVVLVTNGIKK